MSQEQAPSSKKPGAFRRAASFAVLPISAPLGQIRKSTANTRERMAFLRQRKQERLEQLRELEKVSATERFEDLYKKNEWDEEQLARQIDAIRKAKWASLGSCFFWLLLFGFICVYSSLLVAMFLGVVMCGVIALSILNMFRFGLYEAQLKLRSLITAKEFLSRSDMWQRILT